MTDTTYNGWKNHATSNVALWIGNDEGLYHFAKGCESYHDFVTQMRECFASTETPDKVDWDDESLDYESLDELIQEFVSH